MKLDLGKSFDQNRARKRLEHLIGKGAKIELTEYVPKRTNQQNRYLHCCFNILADSTGYTPQEIKSIVKDEVEFMTYEKGGHKFHRSTADLDKEQFGILIDKVREIADMAGCAIPTPEQFRDNQFEVEKEFENVYSKY